jgi:hypothetical protein
MVMRGAQASEKDERDEKFAASFFAPRGNSLWPRFSREEMGAETNFYEILCFLAVKSFFAVIAARRDGVDENLWKLEVAAGSGEQISLNPTACRRSALGSISYVYSCKKVRRRERFGRRVHFALL